MGLNTIKSPPADSALLSRARRLAVPDEASVNVEVYSIRPGPDGLTRITARQLGEAVSRCWVIPTAEAEDAVLDEWAELQDAVLGFPPNW